VQHCGENGSFFLKQYKAFKFKAKTVNEEEWQGFITCKMQACKNAYTRKRAPARTCTHAASPSQTDITRQQLKHANTPFLFHCREHVTTSRSQPFTRTQRQVD